MNIKKWVEVKKTMRLFLAGSVALAATPMGTMASSYEHDSNGRMTGSTSSTAKLSRDIAAANETVARLNAAYGQQQVGTQSPGEKAALEVQQQIRSVRVPEKEKHIFQPRFLEPVTLSGLLGRVVQEEGKYLTDKEMSSRKLKGTLLDNDGQNISFTGKISDQYNKQGQLGRSDFSIEYSDGRVINGSVVIKYGKNGQLKEVSAEATISYPAVQTDQRIVFGFDTQGRVTGTSSRFYQNGKLIGTSFVGTIYNKDGSKLTRMTSDFSPIKQGRHESTTYTSANGISSTRGTFVSTDGKITTRFTSTTIKDRTLETSDTTKVRADGRVDQLHTTRTTNGTKTDVFTKGTVWVETMKGLETAKLVEKGTIVRVGPDVIASEMNTTLYFSNGDKSQSKTSFKKGNIGFLSLIAGIPSLQVDLETPFVPIKRPFLPK